MSDPKPPDILSEFKNIREELRAIETGAQQRHAEVTAKIAQEAVRGTTPNPSRTPNPQKTAQEAVRGTSPGQRATTPQGSAPNPSQTGKNGVTDAVFEEPIDTSDMIDMKRESQQALERNLNGGEKKSFLQRQKESIKASIKAGRERQKASQKLAEKTHPRLSRVNRVVADGAKFALSQSPTARVVAGAKFVVHNTDPETVQRAEKLAEKYGKNVVLWIQEEKGKLTTVTEPFFKREAGKRAEKINELQGKISTMVSRGVRLERPMNLDEVRKTYKPGVKERIEQAQKRIDELKDTPVSLEEAISEKAARAQGVGQRAHNHLNTTIKNNAYEHSANLMTGGAGERYSHMLHTAQHHLGTDAFDLAKHSDRMVRFDQFAAQHLYHSGFGQKEVQQALHSRSPLRSVFDPEKGQFYQGKYHLESKFLDEYSQKTLGFANPENTAVRSQVLDKQKELGQHYVDHKIHPSDIPHHENLTSHFAQQQTERAANNHQSALETLKHYQAQNAQVTDMSASYQHRLEMGRWLEAGHDPEKGHHIIATTLRKAGHADPEIKTVLKEYDVKLNQSEVLTERGLKEVDKTFSQPKHQEEFAATKAFQEKHGLQEERRLDRLNLDKSYKHLEPEKTPTQQHQSSAPTKVQEPERER